MIKSKKGSFFVKKKFYYKKFKNKKNIFLRKYWYFISKKCFLENIIFYFKNSIFRQIFGKNMIFQIFQKIFEVDQCACA